MNSNRVENCGDSLLGAGQSDLLKDNENQQRDLSKLEASDGEGRKVETSPNSYQNQRGFQRSTESGEGTGIIRNRSGKFPIQDETNLQRPFSTSTNLRRKTRKSIVHPLLSSSKSLHVLLKRSTLQQRSYSDNQLLKLSIYSSCPSLIHPTVNSSELSDIPSIFNSEVEYYADLDEEETVSTRVVTPFLLYDNISINISRTGSYTDDSDLELDEDPASFRGQGGYKTNTVNIAGEDGRDIALEFIHNPFLDDNSLPRLPPSVNQFHHNSGLVFPTLDYPIVTSSELSNIESLFDLESEYFADLDSVETPVSRAVTNLSLYDNISINISQTGSSTYESDVEETSYSEMYKTYIVNNRENNTNLAGDDGREISKPSPTHKSISNSLENNTSKLVPKIKKASNNSCSNKLSQDYSSSELSEIPSLFDSEMEYFADLDSVETVIAKPCTPMSLYDNISINISRAVTSTDETECESSKSTGGNKTYIFHHSICIPTLNIGSMSSGLGTTCDGSNSKRYNSEDFEGQGVKILCEKKTSISYFLFISSSGFFENYSSASCFSRDERNTVANKRSSTKFSPRPDPATYCLNIPSESIKYEDESYPSFIAFSCLIPEEEIALISPSPEVVYASKATEEVTERIPTMQDGFTQTPPNLFSYSTTLIKEFEKSCMILKTTYPHYYKHLYSKYEIIREEDFHKRRTNDEHANDEANIRPRKDLLEIKKSNELNRKASKRNYFGFGANSDVASSKYLLTSLSTEKTLNEQNMIDIILISNKDPSHLCNLEKLFETTKKI